MRFRIYRASNLGFPRSETEPPTSAVECVYDKEEDDWYCEIETIEQLKEISLKEGEDLIISFGDGYITIYDDYVE